MTQSPHYVLKDNTRHGQHHSPHHVLKNNTGHGQHHKLLKVNARHDSRSSPHTSESQHHTKVKGQHHISLKVSATHYSGSTHQARNSIFFLNVCMAVRNFNRSRQNHACLWHRHTQKLSQAKNTKITA